MNSPALQRPIRGIIPPVVTPLNSPDSLDSRGAEKLIEHVLAGGVHGLFVLGTTGEGPGLSIRLRRELTGFVCRQVAGRVPVLAGITDTSSEESLKLADYAAEAGALAVVYAGPCYFPVTQGELLAHLERLAPRLPLPVYLYNMPSHTKVSFDVETVRRASDIPRVIGIKDSSGDIGYFRGLCQALAGRPDFALLIGPEELLAEALSAGGHGGVCGGANLFPRLYVALYEAAIRGKAEEAAMLQAAICHLSETIYQVGHCASSYLKGLKCALSIAGLCDDAMAEPLAPFVGADRETIRRRLRELTLPEGTREYIADFGLPTAD